MQRSNALKNDDGSQFRAPCMAMMVRAANHFGLTPMFPSSLPAAALIWLNSEQKFELGKFAIRANHECEAVHETRRATVGRQQV